MGLIEQYDYKIERITKFGDGDSFWCVVSKDIGFHVTAQAAVHIRVPHVDTPERRQPNYVEAGIFAHDWLVQHEQGLRLISEKEDEFGRWLSVVYDNNTGEVLADALKRTDLVKPDSRWNK